ncbi:MAG: DUF445 family protein [Chitinophagales bacterium]
MVYTLPFIAALIGWFTNFLAVKMLFHPREKKRFLFIEFQGVFPKRQHEIAERLGEIVSKELISIDDIKQKLADDRNLEEVKALLETKIDDFIQKRLPATYPALAMFLNDKIKQKIKTQIIEEVEDVLPDAIENYIDKAGSRIDIQALVYEKVVKFSSDKLESIVFAILSKEFQFIELVGAVLGFLIGCVQLLIMYAAG